MMEVIYLDEPIVHREFYRAVSNKNYGYSMVADVLDFVSAAYFSTSRDAR